MRVFLITIALALSSPLLRAQVYNEVGDAGSTQAGAQNTGFNIGPQGGQWTIFGTITTQQDADVYRLVLNAPYTFTATTMNPLTASAGPLPGGLDTQLFLFDASGNPIFANNDSNNTLQSRLPSNSAFTFSLGAGTYYLAISLSGNDPVNSNNQLVFTTGNGDTQAIRGMASGINPTNWNDFDNQANPANQGVGAYEIDIFSTPESGSTIVMMIVALGAVAVVRRRLA